MGHACSDQVLPRTCNPCSASPGSELLLQILFAAAFDVLQPITTWYGKPKYNLKPEGSVFQPTVARGQLCSTLRVIATLAQGLRRSGISLEVALPLGSSLPNAPFQGSVPRHDGFNWSCFHEQMNKD